MDITKLIRRGGPALCNISVTNSCNATCDFCNFARGKVPTGDLRWMDAEQLPRALDILHARDVRYVSLFGGEPLLHPRLTDMIRASVTKGMGTARITNGWLLPQLLDRLAESGLRTIYVSIDAATIADHEGNRGLKGVCERIRTATRRMPELGITAMALVTISKLIRDYQELVPMLRDLGLPAVAFSYPQRGLGSSSLAWSADSSLVNSEDRELAAAFRAADNLREDFPVSNPRASMADMRRHLDRAPERFVCYGGYKSFYMDWNFDMWRCDKWDKRMCTVWDFASTPFVRDGCTACIADCYRDSSVTLHFSVALADAIGQLGEGRVLSALKTLADKRNLESLGAIAGNARVFRKLARLG